MHMIGPQRSMYNNSNTNLIEILLAEKGKHRCLNKRLTSKAKPLY